MNDVRHAIRNLFRTPGVVLAIILTLGLGIGVNASVFSLYKAVMLDSLFFGESENVVRLEQKIETLGPAEFPFSAKEVADYREMSESLIAVEEGHSMSFTLLGLDQPYRVQTDVVSAGFFDMLEVKPLLGRTFRPGEDAADAAPTILLSHRFWQEKTGGDPGIVGQSLVMNSKSHEVIGVLPPGMDIGGSDAYITTPHCPTRSSDMMMQDRDMRMMAVFARKRADVSMEALHTELDVIAKQLAAQYPESYADASRYTVRARRVQDDFSAPFQQTGLLLMLVSALILFAALANVSNLTLARTARRESELNVRAALGASRTRLARLLFIEHAVLGLLGGIAGVGFALLTTELLATFAVRLNPLAANADVDTGVLVYALLVSLGVGILAGLLPVLGLRKDSQPINTQLGTRAVAGSSKGSRTRDGLVVLQIAVTLVVLTASLMMLRSLAQLNSVQPGFTMDNVVSARITLNPARYPDAAARLAFADRLREKMEGIPGITHTGFASLMPMESDDTFNATRLALPDAPNRDPSSLPISDYRVADEGYFDALQIRLLSGRGFEHRDNANSPPVAIVNRSLAEALWPGESALGKRIRPETAMFIDGDAVTYEIVGLVEDVRQYGPRDAEGPAIYTSLRQTGFFGRVLLRTRGDANQVKNALANAVRELDPQQPVDRILTMVEIRSVAVESTQLLTLLLNIFAALVLVISVVGIGGLIIYNVTQRLREFSIRLAVGAQPADLYRLLLRYSTLLIATGSVVGLLGALLIGRALQGYLFDVGAADPISIAIAVALLFIIGTAAVLIPARRLGKLQPADVLADQ